MTIEEYFDVLESDMKKYANATITEAAQYVKRELVKEAEQSIEDFYNHYDPRDHHTPPYYYRHYYNFKENSYKPYYKNAHKTIAHGGIRFTPDNLDKIYRRSATEVADFVWAGFHGPPVGHNINTPVMRPSPYERIMQRKNELEEDSDMIVEMAKEKAKGLGYQILK